MRGFLSGIAVAILLAVVLLCVALTGHINFRADEQPGAMETHLAMKAVDASTERNSPKISNPVQATDENLHAAAGVYRDVLTDRSVSTTGRRALALRDVLAVLPIAVLEPA